MAIETHHNNQKWNNQKLNGSEFSTIHLKWLKMFLSVDLGNSYIEIIIPSSTTTKSIQGDILKNTINVSRCYSKKMFKLPRGRQKTEREE